MTTSFASLARRVAEGSNISHTMLNLLVALLVLLILSLLLVAGLLFFRYRRRAREAKFLPLYDERRMSTSTTSSHHRRVLVRPSEAVYVYKEKKNLVDVSATPVTPDSPIPEIRITFPEEFDAAGKRQSERVMVVRVGETSVGLEPVCEAKLPAYAEDERFQSLDLERIGGLVEKARNAPESWR